MTSFEIMINNQTKKEMIQHQVWLLGIIERAPKGVSRAARKQLTKSYAVFDQRFIQEVA